MAEKKECVPEVQLPKVARRPSFRKTLRDNEYGLAPEYLEELESMRKKLDDSIHKYIAAKEREYKTFEKEIHKRARNANGGGAASASTAQQQHGTTESNGSIVVAKRRTSTEPAQDVGVSRSFLPGQQDSDAVRALLAASAGRAQHSQAIDDEVGEYGPALAGLTERRVSEEREKEFVGLFTPPFITAIDNREDRDPSSSRRGSAPASVESSRQDGPLKDTLEALAKPNSDTALQAQAQVKRPLHLQLVHRTSSSGSSADGKLASALKSSGSAKRTRIKRVSLAIGDNMVVKPSDDAGIILGSSSTSSHSRARSPSNDRAQSDLMSQSSTLDFARQPISLSASAGTSGLGTKGIATMMGEALAASTAPNRTAEVSAQPSRPPSIITPRVVPKSKSKIDADGDLFDLEAEDSDMPPQAPDIDMDSAIEDDAESVPGLAGRLEHLSDRAMSTSIPMTSPGLRPGETYEYDPEAGLVPEPASALDTIESQDHAIHVEFGSASAMASRQPTDPGFRRPSVHNDPVSKGSDYAAAEARASTEDIYGSSGRPNKMSFTGGSLGESYMARHAEEMMKLRMVKREQEVRM